MANTSDHYIKFTTPALAPESNEVTGNHEGINSFPVLSYQLGSSHHRSGGGGIGASGKNTVGQTGTVTITMPMMSGMPELMEGSFKAKGFEKIEIGTFTDSEEKSSTKITLMESKEDMILVTSCNVQVDGNQSTMFLTLDAPKVQIANDGGKDITMDIHAKGTDAKRG